MCYVSKGFGLNTMTFEDQKLLWWASFVAIEVYLFHSQLFLDLCLCYVLLSFEVSEEFGIP